MPHNIKNEPITIWFFTDGKPGHINQLRGIRNRLKHHRHIEDYWIETAKLGSPWLRGLFKQYNLSTSVYPKPHMAVTAGHAGHGHVWASKRQFNAFSCVLMSPSLPYSSFDAVIAPHHDTPPKRPNVFPTTGVVNHIQPSTNIDLASHNQSPQTILIGGPSKHFTWNNISLINQIEQLICKDHRDSFTLITSRRTPADFLNELTRRNICNLSINDVPATTNNNMNQLLNQSKAVWVTPDSVSMVCEAITSGRPTGIFDLTQTKKHKTRVTQMLNELIATKQLNMLSDYLGGKTLFETDSTLWEAERAAIWLLERFDQYQQSLTRKAGLTQ